MRREYFVLLNLSSRKRCLRFQHGATKELDHLHYINSAPKVILARAVLFTGRNCVIVS